ncbi:MAG: hypothetical protein COB36_02390 [Alphaproteobacteria bacterium]|nr:MAG: hypothetical protein COB36_02390 [Alphaproteobacteria bacterium]
MHIRNWIYNPLFFAATLLCAAICVAGTTRATPLQKHSPALTGFLGLNTIPSARMDEVGTVRMGVSTLDPYLHGYIGIQIAEPLHINIRQTAEVSNLTEAPKTLYPGVDLKLRLIKENTYRPEISLGLQSAFGHKRMAGEYIALSKRYNNFDFTAGIGWGRLGSAGHFNNPFKILGSHFDHDRNPDSDTPNTPSNWFTGDKIGLFAGVEYFLPYDGLSLKLDYGADRYTAEKNNFDYESPAPWGIGLAYTHNDWLSASIGMQGTDKVMGRISLQSIPSKWPFTHKTYPKPKPFYKQRNARLNIASMTNAAANDDITLTGITSKGQSIFAILDISPHIPAPQQIGRAVRHIAAHSGQDIEEIIITPRHVHLMGTPVKIMRSDVENYLKNNLSSPQEIWKNTEFVVTTEDNKTSNPFLSIRRTNNKTTFTLALENQISLSEEESGILYRSSAFLNLQSSPFLGFLTGTSLRLNLDNNLSERAYLNKTHPTELTKSYAQARISLENAYVGYTHSLTPDLHFMASAGYLEEGYAGLGGEILYRPFSSRFALGAEIWSVTPRQANSPLNMGLYTGQNSITGHINGWYDLPHHDITLHARAGRFIAGDVGGSLELEKIFKNGAKLTGLVSLSNYSDTDIYGGTTHAYNSLKLTLPFGNIPYIPTGSEIRTKIAPFDRVTAQSINPPQRLFEMTENFTLDHMAKHWTNILD